MLAKSAAGQAGNTVDKVTCCSVFPAFSCFCCKSAALESRKQGWNLLLMNEWLHIQILNEDY